MLKLENINKDYISGDTTVHALKNINIEFRERVCIYFRAKWWR